MRGRTLDNRPGLFAQLSVDSVSGFDANILNHRSFMRYIADEMARPQSGVGRRPVFVL